MKTMLHIVNKSPTERSSLDSCLRLATPGNSVLLIEDGVYAALETSKISATLHERNQDIEFFVLEPDLQARGLSPEALNQAFKIIDYAGFVDLVAGHSVNQSWL